MRKRDETFLTAVGAAHFDTIARLERPAGPSSIPARVAAFAGGAAFNACRQFVRAGGRSELHTTGPTEDLAPFAAGVKLRQLARPTTTPPSYTAVLNPDGELAVGFADMRSYDELEASACPDVSSASHVLIDANLPVPFLEAVVAGLNADTSLYAMAVSPAKASRLTTIASRIDILFANRREIAASGLEARAAVITDGAEGLAYEGVKRHVLRADRLFAVDVTGAGDAVTGAFLHALITGSEVPDALRRAAAAAGETIIGEGPFPFLDQ